MGKQLFNLHTHTQRCGHADGTDIQYVKSAIDAGFKQLGFSEHIPFEEIRLKGARMFIEQKEEYYSSLKLLQKQFKDQIDIKIG
ncbi:PHP domain-containing protein, partial [Thomasclavelia sp.]